MCKHYFKQWHCVNKLFFLVVLFMISFISNAQTKQAVPYATVAGHETGSRMSIATLKENSALSVFTKNAPTQNYYVVSYKIVMDHPGGNIESAICQGSAFSTQAKQYLEKYSEHGRLISFEDIRVKDDKGKELKIPSIFYIVD